MIVCFVVIFIIYFFYVIILRFMVQFIGREFKYCGFCDFIVIIYWEEGILGFFVGFVFCFLGDIFFLWLCNLLVYFVNIYVLDSGVFIMNEMKSYF